MKNKKTILKIIFVVSAVAVCIGVAGAIYANYLLNRVQYEKKEDTPLQEEFFEQDDGAEELDELSPEDVVWEQQDGARRQEGVYNFLLVGEEAIGAGKSRGRTDSIMLVTLHVKQKAIKITSLMRDIYVQIPGYSDNKLNAAYHNGGMPLLVETIQLNFQVAVDGYAKVDFESFEQLIDQLGGVEITLTEKEAAYLNRTNYISNPAYRNVIVGTQILNGNQALGYSRIRYVSTETEANDFGRTSRQRNVLMAIFQKYKEKSAVELIALLPDILSLVTTDRTKADLIEYISLIVTMHPDELQTMRVPIDNGYQNANIRGMSVLILEDADKNRDALHDFIFG
ncbi:LCP family protein [Anaeromicropila populeti]|uniref:Transcriptional attenuator, LytR family n=1 Tax=Anaeromicropila populeti TaxID=37658 RepID=A0A1I6KXZ5_9FIRM|nr:LCP family protein [Anaeromicropila populeti]SFR96074.1 transcriptional attenuator, LytR family [Anaeromicropila populeti]